MSGVCVIGGGRVIELVVWLLLVVLWFELGCVL